MKKKFFLIVGAGFAGAVVARELADFGHDVTIIDKRSHIGGNAWDHKDKDNILVHPYGPHIFHTNSKKIIEWLSRFTEWRFYEHRVLSKIGENYYPIPINRTTINLVFDKNLKENEVEDFLETIRDPKEKIVTSEDSVLNSVGHKLCDMFFRGYTRKQWGKDLSDLSASVASRIPIRTNDDDRYFNDTYQFMPSEGYGALFERIISQKNIKIRLNTKYEKANENSYDHIVYTGAIDEFFDYKFGKLPYRSLRFEHFHIKDVDENSFKQKAAVINYPNEENFTRITEFKKITGQISAGTSMVKEFPSNEGEPYYPIPNKENNDLFEKYKKEAENKKNISFVGRLAQYKYYNMDQVVAAALSLSKEIAAKN